jgi:hypothetical protein
MKSTVEGEDENWEREDANFEHPSELATESPPPAKKAKRNSPGFVGRTDSESGDYSGDPHAFLMEGLTNTTNNEVPTNRMRAPTKTATTGTRHGVVSGLRGLSVTPREVKHRPLMPKDFLAHNALMEDGTDRNEQRLVMEGGELVAKAKRKTKECADVVEWSACNMRLMEHYRLTKQLDKDEEKAYLSYHLLVMEYSRTKMWAYVVEYDHLCRYSVYRNGIGWDDGFAEEYEAAFSVKPQAGHIGSSAAMHCTICNSSDHAPGAPGCIFRNPGTSATTTSTATGGGGGGGVPRAPRPSNGGGANPKFPNRANVDKNAGDKVNGIWFHTIGSRQVCIKWNRAVAGDECSATCPEGRLHVCSYCKGKHRSKECPKAKTDGHA